MKTPFVVSVLRRLGWLLEDAGDTCWVRWQMLRVDIRRLRCRLAGRDPGDVEF